MGYILVISEFVYKVENHVINDVVVNFNRLIYTFMLLCFYKGDDYISHFKSTSKCELDSILLDDRKSLAGGLSPRQGILNKKIKNS